jgi:hypothetical protein
MKMDNKKIIRHIPVILGKNEIHRSQFSDDLVGLLSPQEVEQKKLV